jgi:hypothetical protein
MHHAGWLRNDPTPRTNPLADKPKGKRQRQVFPTREIPHLWAHKTQECARNLQGNLYFHGDTIYSYGSHYPLAMHVYSPKGQHAILVNVSTANSGGSVTTAGQRSRVRQSIPNDVPVYDVNGLLYGNDHTVNISSYRAQAKEALTQAQNARKYGSGRLQAAFTLRDIAESYCKFFGLDKPDFSFLPTGKELHALHAQIAERTERAGLADVAKEARATARRAEEARIRALELPERIAAWRAHGPVNSWALAGVTLLRMSKDGSEVETSRGARVPVDHARRVLALVQKIKERNEPFIANGHTIAIGHYRVDRIDANGTLHAGCHTIAYDEIMALAPQLQGGN